jgi:hypothetical protein
MSKSSPNHDILTLDHHRSRLPRGAVLAIASIAQFMVVLDVTIINVALLQMRTALHMSASGQQWVINVYALTFAGFLMLGGRAADVFCRRRVFIIGLATFTLFSLVTARPNELPQGAPAGEAGVLTRDPTDANAVVGGGECMPGQRPDLAQVSLALKEEYSCPPISPSARR